MKIYFSPSATFGDLTPRQALFRAEQSASMWLENEREHGSRYADVSTVLEFNGYGNDAVHSNRRPNDRGKGGGYLYAATWDQWGILLSNLFALDPKMKVGGYKRPYYDGVDDFHFQTGDRFKRRFTMEDLSIRTVGVENAFHGDHRFQFSGVVGEQKCTKCSAVKRWQ